MEWSWPPSEQPSVGIARFLSRGSELKQVSRDNTGVDRFRAYDLRSDRLFATARLRARSPTGGGTGRAAVDCPLRPIYARAVHRGVPLADVDCTDAIGTFASPG